MHLYDIKERGNMRRKRPSPSGAGLPGESWRTGRLALPKFR